MDLDDKFDIGRLIGAVMPGGAVSLPYIAPALTAMDWELGTGYTAPAGDAVTFEIVDPSVLTYQWAWYDSIEFGLSTGYTAPAGDAINIEIETP